MFNCEKFRELIEKYIDNELDVKEKAQFEEHLKICPDCEEEYKFSLEIRSAIKDIKLPEPPSDFLERVNKAIDNDVLINNKKSKVRPFVNWKAYQAVAACLIVAAVIGVNAGDFTDRLSKNEPEALVERKVIDVVASPQPETELDIEPTVTPKPEKVVTQKTTKPKQTKKPEKTPEIINKPIDKDEILDMQKTVNSSETLPVTDENNGISAASIAPDVTEEIKYVGFDEEINENQRISSDGSGAAGGGSRAIQENNEEIGTVSVENDMLEEAKILAQSYGTYTDGVYEMPSANYTHFLNSLNEQGIEYSAEDAKTDIVKFVINSK